MMRVAKLLLFPILVVVILALCPACLAGADTDLVYAQLETSGPTRAVLTNRGGVVYAETSGRASFSAVGLPVPYATSWTTGVQILMIFADEFVDAIPIGDPLPGAYEGLVRKWLGDTFIQSKGITFTGAEESRSIVRKTAVIRGNRIITEAFGAKER